MVGNPGGAGTGNPYHDPKTGKFTYGGSGGKEPKGELVTKAKEATPNWGIGPLNTKVTDVGGDEWNRKTAVRLEQEYEIAKPHIEAAAKAIIGKEIQIKSAQPQSWDDLTQSAQEDAEQAWKDNHLESFIDNEISNYHESGEAYRDAMGQIAHKVIHQGLDQLLADEGDDNPIDQVREDWAGESSTWDVRRPGDVVWGTEKTQREAQRIAAKYDDAFVVEVEGKGGGKEIPYTNEQIMGALDVEVEDYDPPRMLVSIDETKLGMPAGFDESPSLPGIEPEHPTDRLTKEMRKDITDAVRDYLTDLADKKQSDMEPDPQYIEDTAKEYLDEMWGEMDEYDKFEAAKENLDGLQDEYADEGGGAYLGKKGPVHEPSHLDPLEEHPSSQDYKDTQRFMQALSVERAAQLMVERGVVGSGPFKSPKVFAENYSPQEKGTLDEARRQAAWIDANIWAAWKSSSRSQGGMVLQAAAAEELGARPSKHLNVDDLLIKTYARDYGGFDAVKAYVRAKWEVTQYALDKSGDDTVQVYRALKHTGAKPTGFEAMGSAPLTDIQLNRNGMASTTLDRSVANHWGDSNRTVLRIEVPRTAVVSVPAYGGNYHEEHEVVVAGTAWKGWDAWYRDAPSFDEKPIGGHWDINKSPSLTMGVANG